jgi:hypothetical protein
VLNIFYKSQTVSKQPTTSQRSSPHRDFHDDPHPRPSTASLRSAEQRGAGRENEMKEGKKQNAKEIKEEEREVRQQK